MRERPCSDNEAVLNAILHPIIRIDAKDTIKAVNTAAETFFSASQQSLIGSALQAFIPATSPLSATLAQVRKTGTATRVRRVDLRLPANRGGEADVFAGPLEASPGAHCEDLLIMLEARTLDERMGQHTNQVSATRAVTGLVSMLAHEVKNPLSGIRGAAQLLESSVDDRDRTLTALIRDECDRIVRLIERMETFGDEAPFVFAPVNMHDVFRRVKQLAQAGFASHVEIVEDFDPSLPMVMGNRDQLIQVILNLVKNAAEALSGKGDGRVTLKSQWYPGVKIKGPGLAAPHRLTLAFSVVDNGPGLSEALRDHVFEPFVSARPEGAGLGLTLSSKIINEHGGVIDYKRQGHLTLFRILLAPAPG